MQKNNQCYHYKYLPFIENDLLYPCAYCKENNKYKPMQKITITTKDAARQAAIDWQTWQVEKSLSYQELADWQDYFQTLADKFGLQAEFEENGII